MASHYLPLTSPPPLADRALPWLLLIWTLGGACLFLFVAGLAGMPITALALVGGAALAWVVWRWPVGSSIGLVAVAPVFPFLMFLLFSLTGARMATTFAHILKDGLILVLVARVAHEAFLRRQAPRVHFLDLLIVMFLALSAIYVVYPGTLPDNTLMGRVLGFRFDAYFLLAYFVGRGLALRPEHVRLLLLALIPGSVAVGVVAIIEWVAPAMMSGFYESLGFSEFMRAIGGSKVAPLLTRELGGLSLTRVSSLLMGELDLAFFLLLGVPLAAAILFSVQRPAVRLMAGLFLVLMIATVVMTTTRSALLSSLVALALMTFILRAWGRATAVGLGLVVLALVFALGTGVTGGSLGAFLSPGESSAVAHTDAVQESFLVVQEEPLGRGLGTAFAVAHKLQLQNRITNESWYLQLATEMGIAAGALFMLIMLFVVGGSLSSYLRAKDPWLRALCLTMAGAAIGFTLVGMVLHVFQTAIVANLFWLLAGIAIGAPGLERSWTREAGAEP